MEIWIESVLNQNLQNDDLTNEMTQCKHREEHVIISSLSDEVDGEVEDGEGQPADEKDCDHAYE